MATWWLGSVLRIYYSARFSFPLNHAYFKPLTMPSSKRSRALRSAHFGDTEFVLRCSLVTSPPPPSPIPLQATRSKVLTLSSPVLDATEEHAVPPHFLEKCFFCKKTFGPSDDVFMHSFSYLRAFCSSECRDNQMSKDKKMGNVPGGSLGVRR